MRDPYEILGVPRTATAADIRKAYRDLAKRYHPDLNPEDTAAESRFKEITAAYNLLEDDEKRARFDRGEIDASGAEQRGRQFYRGFADGPEGAKYHSFEDIMSDLFTTRRGRRGQARGGDLSYTLNVDFVDAAAGSKKTVTMPDGRALRLSIPAGVRDGQTLRLKGKGRPGLGGGPAGDALVEVHVRSHPLFRRDGKNIQLELPITLGEAVLGGKVTVPTVSGSVTMTIPPASNTGTVLRLRGKGIGTGNARGDQLVTLKVVLPDKPDAELKRFVERWAARHEYDPRGETQQKAAS